MHVSYGDVIYITSGVLRVKMLQVGYIYNTNWLQMITHQTLSTREKLGHQTDLKLNLIKEDIVDFLRASQINLKNSQPLVCNKQMNIWEKGVSYDTLNTPMAKGLPLSIYVTRQTRDMGNIIGTNTTIWYKNSFHIRIPFAIQCNLSNLY